MKILKIKLMYLININKNKYLVKDFITYKIIW